MNKKNRWEYLSLPVLVAAVLTACAGTQSEPSDAFLAPISDQTMDIIAEVHFGLQLGESVQLNHYLQSDTPKADAWLTIWEDLVLAMRAIIYYSADLVDIAEAAEDAQAIEPLITSVASLDSNLRALPAAQPYLKPRDMEALYSKIREQENIIHALRQVLPVTLEYSIVVTEILAEADRTFADAFDEVYDMVESTHSPMLAYGKNLTARQNDTLEQLAIMDRVWGGDESAWPELLGSDWALSSEIGKGVRLTPSTAMQAEQFLIARLGAIATIRQYLELAQFAYQNELQELYDIEDETEATLRVALLVLQNWERSQQQLARGEKGAFSALTSSLLQVIYRRVARR